MAIACEPTKEQKEYVFKTYKSLYISNYDSKPNLYIDFIHNKFGQTSRTKSEDDFWSKNYTSYCPYFIWVSFEDFLIKLNHELMKQTKIKF